MGTTSSVLAILMLPSALVGASPTGLWPMMSGPGLSELDPKSNFAKPSKDGGSTFQTSTSKSKLLFSSPILDRINHGHLVRLADQSDEILEDLITTPKPPSSAEIPVKTIKGP